ncbi:MAG: chalcone isomerase family protein [Acidovorax sp.]|uniref:chalcone isomerase family protein n=1 Tax=Acidovorax sp. TaxID=1872122 RepID=UPI000ADEDAD7|nr:chalcone isomerase family protein [Acidovorax sp.]MDH4447140.1 chalcone isomerase family protein [Acidovorax sp.]MDH4465491.1 chalcone isomerase family protein [Acidovorax sp.]
MKNVAVRAVTIAATAVFCLEPAVVRANTPSPAQARPAEAVAGPASVGGATAGMRLAGQGALRFLGFEVYSARLWVRPGFDLNDYATQPLALELTYQRNFTAEAIAKRSIDEMRRVGSFSAQQAARWQEDLKAALPDVKPGDRLTGLYRPGTGAVFEMGGKVVGEVPDAEFARLFFGIWLSPQTSEPGLRQELVSALRPAGRP